MIKEETYTSIIINNNKVKFFTPNKMTKWRVDTYFTKEPETLEWIDSFDKKEKIIFWDIGSNIGLYSIYAALKFENIEVVAFEPSTSNLRVLSRNISINNLENKIKITQFPLTNKENQYLLLKEKEFVEGGALNAFGEKFDFEGKNFEGKNNYKVYGTTINYLIKNNILQIPNYIKIDVDGIEHLILEGASEYLNNNNIKSLELPDEWIFKAYNYCKKKKIGFLCAAFDHESVDFINKKLKCKTIKSPSSEINNKDLLEYMSKKFNSLIVSTGASNLAECLSAKKWIIKKNVNADLLFMHCVSEYPAPLKDSNLNVIKSMSKYLKVPIGFSDHSEGIIAPILSIQNGCVIIEKHFTLDKNMPGPDHKASIEPDQLKKLAEVIKNYSSIMGDGKKIPRKSELKNKNLIRKSAVCSKIHIKKGTKITYEDINFKRSYIPGSINPQNFKKIIGKKIKKNINFDKPFFYKDFK